MTAPSAGGENVRVGENQVRLVRGRGSPGRGARGNYWHVVLDDKRAGNVFINTVEDEDLGKHASIQIHLNEGSRGRGVGSIAYRLACEASGYEIVYAHMRKSNTASRRAARNAGFDEISGDFRQLTMRWRRTPPVNG